MTTPRVEPRLLEPLPVADRADVLAAAVTRRFRRGETLVQEGEPGESLHLVSSGRLAVRVSTPDGATATLTVISAAASTSAESLRAATDFTCRAGRVDRHGQVLT